MDVTKSAATNSPPMGQVIATAYDPSIIRIHRYEREDYSMLKIIDW